MRASSRWGFLLWIFFSSVVEHAGALVPCLSKVRRRRGLLLRSTTTSEDTDELPLPSVGDVVAFAGEWPGESSAGQITSLQRRGDSWIADVVTMEDQAGNVWRAPSGYKKNKRRFLQVRDLVPLAATYVEEVDGYLIEREDDDDDRDLKPLNGTAVGLVTLAEGYRDDFPENYRPPTTPRLDPDQVEEAAVAYEELKKRLALDGALAGFVGAGLIGVVLQSVADSVAFAIGALASVAYVLLLGRAADKVGDPQKDLMSSSRFAPPVLAFLTLAAYHYAMDPASIQPFSIVPRDEFAATAAGILSYRVPLLARGVGGELDASDVASLLPGSLGVAAKAIADEEEERLLSSEEDPAAVPVQDSILVVCGPPGTGKTTLTKKLLAEDDRFVAPKWTLLTPAQGATYDDRPRLDVVQDEQLATKLAAEAPVLLDCPRSLYDPVTPEPMMETFAAAPRWILRRSELLNRPDGKIPVLDCDVETARQLEYLAGSRLVGVWVSMDSEEAIQDRLSGLELQRASTSDADDIVALVNKTVTTKLRPLIDDLEFGISSPMFDYTIITDHDFPTSYARLLRAANFAFDENSYY